MVTLSELVGITPPTQVDVALHKPPPAVEEIFPKPVVA